LAVHSPPFLIAKQKEVIARARDPGLNPDEILNLDIATPQADRRARGVRSRGGYRVANDHF
jgi:hypothetical protein